MDRSVTIALIATFTLACTNSSSVKIPFSSDPGITVNGNFDNNEWTGGKSIQITPYNYLLLIQDNGNIYLGIKNQENVARYVDLYLYHDSFGTLNLHASMQLGERLLMGNWNDTTPEWNWGNNENWSANKVEVVNDDENISFFESLKPYQGHEFQISKRRIRNSNFRLRVEIKDFVGEAKDIVFPENSDKRNTATWLQVYLD